MNNPRMTDPKNKKKKSNLSYVISSEMAKQVEGRMDKVNMTTTNLYCMLSSIPDAYLHEDDEAYHITLKAPLFEGQPSIFDFRKNVIKLLITNIKSRWPLNCTYTDEFSLTVVKIVGTVCIEQYDRETYLSNGSRQEPTKPYVNFNKGRSTGAKRNRVTIEIEED